MILMRQAPHPTRFCGLLLAAFFMSATALQAQEVQIVAISMGLGSGPRVQPLEVAQALARFDVVAADRVGGAEDMERLLAGMGDNWEAILDGTDGSYGFLYNERIEAARELGTYHGESRFAQPPYGVQFRVPSTGLVFNLVGCRISTGEAGGLADVTRYFEKLTGNRGITILAVDNSNEKNSVRAEIIPAPALHRRLHSLRNNVSSPIFASLTLNASRGN